MTIYKKFIIQLLFLIITLGLSSCSSDDSPTGIGSGMVNLNLNINPSIITSSQAPPSILIPQPDDFSIFMNSNDGNISQSWDTFVNFPQNQLFRSGSYTLTASYGNNEIEGFDCPYFIGNTTIQVSENTTTNANIDCKLANSLVTITYTDAFKNFFEKFNILIHSEGGAYFSYDKDETRPLYLNPGKISIITSLTKKNGVSATFQPAEITNALAQHLYHITFDVNIGENGTEELLISFDDSAATENIALNISDEMMKSPAPEVATIGVHNNETINLEEGCKMSAPIVANITSASGFKEIVLTTQSKSLINSGFPNEIELVNASEEHKNTLSSMGLKIDGLWNNSSNIASLDFTNLLSNISVIEESNNISTFTIIAKDKFSKINNPLTFYVSVAPIEINVNNTPKAIIGINKTNIALSSPNKIDPTKLKFLASNDNHEFCVCNINNVSAINDTTYSVDLSIPNGVNNSDLKILYNGSNKANISIERVQPEFTIEVDAFANKAHIKINAKNDSLTEVITNNISIYANDTEPAILARNITYGIISISGLKPETSYKIKATMMKGNPNAVYSNTVVATTESKSNVPDGDFEDVKERINCIILSGGKYSQTHLPIYNQQNKTEVIVSTPKKNWATVNSKTFHESSTNKNTWYLQPSTMTIYDAISGSKAMKLSSVAWDANGEEITDYAQKQGEYVPYNKNIPHISYRAAGKLFLGEYKFDAKTNTEIYDEGIPFSSRPTALNGYYKYTPSIDQLHDKGLVIISIINKTKDSETEIAHGEFLFSGNSDYTAFNVPLSYKSFGIKATHLRIMFASSNNIGSIQDETMKIITSHDVASASSIGSSLWIDNLTFSY